MANSGSKKTRYLKKIISLVAHVNHYRTDKETCFYQPQNDILAFFSIGIFFDKKIPFDKIK